MRIGYNRGITDQYSKFTAVILAGGMSSRMKDFKPLLYVDGQTAIEGLLESVKATGIENTIVVTGHNREALQQIIAVNGAEEAYNADYEQGMFSSIKTGLEAAKAKSPSAPGVLLIPVDCPLISINVMRAVMAAACEEGAGEDFAVATYEGKKGHPLFVPTGMIDEIVSYEGEGGLKAITDKYWERMNRVPVNEEGCILDMDTPEGYADIRAFVTKGFAREKLELLTARKRIFLVRHGETQQHDEPMFIGQYDVPLSDEGRRQAEVLGEQIAEAMTEDIDAELLGMDKFGKEPMPAIERIYSSDLSRASETAEIICKAVNRKLASRGSEQQVQVSCREGLREIDLGEWDGRPIREIREEAPELYERRGSDLFTFKTGNKAENFYDMQYRAVDALRQLLRFDDGKDIIIVTHSGVIRALENNILGGRVDDEWEQIGKGCYRMLEPFPEPKREKVHGDKPMNINDLTMESVLEYYE